MSSVSRVICRQIWIHRNDALIAFVLSHFVSTANERIWWKTIPTDCPLSNFFLDSRRTPTAVDTKKVDRRQRQSRSMDIKGITETSLMWFSSVTIRPSRYARYLQFGRASIGAEAMQQEGRRSIRRVPCQPRYFLLSIKIPHSSIVTFRNIGSLTDSRQFCYQLNRRDH